MMRERLSGSKYPQNISFHYENMNILYCFFKFINKTTNTHLQAGRFGKVGWTALEGGQAVAKGGYSRTAGASHARLTCEQVVLSARLCARTHRTIPLLCVLRLSCSEVTALCVIPVATRVARHHRGTLDVLLHRHFR